MATRFVRVDLSEMARDYRPIAVEPGVAMLDPSGANARILFRWLGGMVAEPEWEEDTVGFYVRDDKGGRLEDVVCQSASAQDLKGVLCDDLAKLRQRLDQSRGETATERSLRKVLLRTFGELVDDPGRTDLESYFFKYRDVMGDWRLIWCWGYERLDHEPAPPVICTDPDCNLLFVRRPGKSPRCPHCESAAAPAQAQDPLEACPALVVAAVAAVRRTRLLAVACYTARHQGPICRPGRHADRGLPGGGEKVALQEPGCHARGHRHRGRPRRGQLRQGDRQNQPDGPRADQDQVPIPRPRDGSAGHRHETGRHRGPIQRSRRHADRLPGDGRGALQAEGRHAATSSAPRKTPAWPASTRRPARSA